MISGGVPSLIRTDLLITFLHRKINSADALVVTRLILENKLLPRDCWLVVFQEKEHYNGHFIER